MNARHTKSIVTAVAVAAFLTLATGCQHQRMTERRAQMRRDNIARVFESIERSEAKRPAKVHQTLAAIERKWHRDVENTRRNRELVAEFFERDFRRWEEQQPAYRSTFERLILNGKPENIEPTAIILFW